MDEAALGFLGFGVNAHVPAQSFDGATRHFANGFGRTLQAVADLLEATVFAIVKLEHLPVSRR